MKCIACRKEVELGQAMTYCSDCDEELYKPEDFVIWVRKTSATFKGRTEVRKIVRQMYEEMHKFVDRG